MSRKLIISSSTINQIHLKVQVRLKIFQKGKVIFKTNPTAVDLPEVSRLIDSAKCRRRGDKRKHSFLEKKNTPEKGKWIHYEHKRNITSLDGSCYQAINSSISQNIHTHTNIYTYIICGENDSK